MEEEKKEYKYILFPLPLLREIFKKPKNGFRDIFNVGLYKTSKAQSISKYNALKQLIYCYYRGGLTDSLKKKLNLLEKEEIFYRDDDYNGFNGYEFVPDDDIENIYNYCKEYPEFQEEIEEFYRLRQVKDMLNLEFDIASICKRHKEYDKIYNGFKSQPLVSIKTGMMFDYYQNDKTDYEKALFAMYAGIRSIIGDKNFAATTGSMIKCRMFGAKNQNELEIVLKEFIKMMKPK